jgi:hypothetical protein
MSYCILWINLWYILYMKLPFGKDLVSWCAESQLSLSLLQQRSLLRSGSLLVSLITKNSLFIHTIKHKQLLPEITISNSNVRCLIVVIWKLRYLNNNSFFASQGNPRILWDGNSHYRVHNCPPLTSVLSQMNPMHDILSYICGIIFNIILSSAPNIPSGLSPHNFTPTFYANFTSLCSPHCQISKILSVLETCLTLHH